MHPKEFIINLHFRKSIVLLKRRPLKNFIADRLLKAGKSGSDLNIVFCSDDELLAINRKHLKHDYFTDIITFDLSEKDSNLLVSDIYISVDRVKDNAKTMKGSQNNELHRVIFHGILHLIGYKDKAPKEARKMREMEDSWLMKYEYANVPREK